MKEEMFKCFKVRAIKVAEKAVRAKSLSIADGVRLVGDGRLSRSLGVGSSFNESELESLDDQGLNDVLGDAAKRFLDSHQLEIKIPQLVEEGRKRKGGYRGGSNAALYWALAIKGTFLAVAYKGIAIMSGLALVMGKMALILTAILGLKKLVSSGQESTTLEIIKQPKYSESHSHSTSYEDEHKSYDRNDWEGSTRIIKTYF